MGGNNTINSLEMPEHLTNKNITPRPILAVTTAGFAWARRTFLKVQLSNLSLTQNYSTMLFLLPYKRPKEYLYQVRVLTKHSYHSMTSFDAANSYLHLRLGQISGLLITLAAA